MLIEGLLARQCMSTLAAISAVSIHPLRKTTGTSRVEDPGEVDPSPVVKKKPEPGPIL